MYASLKKKTKALPFVNCINVMLVNCDIDMNPAHIEELGGKGYYDTLNISQVKGSQQGKSKVGSSRDEAAMYLDDIDPSGEGTSQNVAMMNELKGKMATLENEVKELKLTNANLVQLQSLNDARFKYLKSKLLHSGLAGNFDDEPKPI